MSSLARNFVQILLAATALSMSTFSWGESQFIDIFPKNESDIHFVLEAVEERLQSPSAEIPPPIILMLHGPEAQRFLKSHYQENRTLVDRAAKLSGYGLLDVKICQTWLNMNEYGETELFPFVSPVPFGMDELERLEEEGYTEFSVNL